MRLSVEELLKTLEARATWIDKVVQNGVVPGDIDTYELERMKGRLEELKYVIWFITENSIISTQPA